MKFPGFKYDGRIIYYIDPKGKDAGFDRWRLTLYYAPHYAATHFLPTEAAYNQYLENHQKHTYLNYDDFRRDAEKEGIRDSY